MKLSVLVIWFKWKSVFCVVTVEHLFIDLYYHYTLYSIYYYCFSHCNIQLHPHGGRVQFYKAYSNNPTVFILDWNVIAKPSNVFSEHISLNILSSSHQWRGSFWVNTRGDKSNCLQSWLKIEESNQCSTSVMGLFNSDGFYMCRSVL